MRSSSPSLSTTPSVTSHVSSSEPSSPAVSVSHLPMAPPLSGSSPPQQQQPPQPRPRRVRCAHGARCALGTRHQCQPAMARGACSREQTLRRRHAAAGRLREAALYEKGRRAHAHNAHVAEVAARAKARHDRDAEEAREAVRRRQVEAEERRERVAEGMERRRRDVSIPPRHILRATRSPFAVSRPDENSPTDKEVKSVLSHEGSSAMELVSSHLNSPVTPSADSTPGRNREISKTRASKTFADVDTETELQVSTPCALLRCKQGEQNSYAASGRVIGHCDSDRRACCIVRASAHSCDPASDDSLNSLPSSPLESSAGQHGQARSASLVTSAAARRIAGYWLLALARKGLAAVGLLAPCKLLSDFEQTTAAVQTREADVAACHALRAMGTNPRASRILLASFVVATHFENVLDGDEDDERNALFAARRIVLCMQAGTLPALAYAWREWMHAHASWKAKDKERLSEAIIADALATEAIQCSLRQGYSGHRGTLGDVDPAVPIWEEQIDKKQKQLRRAMFALGGQHAVAKLDAAVTRARGMPDEYIAHEIMMDCDTFVSHFKQPVVPDDVWTNLYAELSASQTNTGGLFLRLERIEADMNAIREGSFPPFDREQVYIDPSFATRFISNVADVLLELQAEAYDEELRSWVRDASCRLSNGVDTAACVVAVLRELTQRVSDLRETVSVTRVLLLAPIVQQHGVEWERLRFSERLARGEISSDLPRTRKFVEAALSRLDMNGDKTNAPDVNHVRRVVRIALVVLCSAPIPVNASTVPEILVLDVDRLVTLQNEFQRIALVCVLDNIARQFMSSKFGQPHGAASNAYQSDMLRSMLRDDLNISAIQEDLVATVSASLRASGFSDAATLSAEHVKFLHGMVVRGTRTEDSLFRLLFQRVAQRIQDVLLVVGDGSSMITSCSPVLDVQASKQVGVGIVHDEILTIVSQLEKLAVHLYDVHGETIVRLTSDCVAQSKSSDASSSG